jgi:hypothetical protein
MGLQQKWRETKPSCASGVVETPEAHLGFTRLAASLRRPFGPCFGDITSFFIATSDEHGVPDG